MDALWSEISLLKETSFMLNDYWQNWMFLKVRGATWSVMNANDCMVIWQRAWPSGSCEFVFLNASVPNYAGSYKRLFEKQGSVLPVEELKQKFFSCETKQSLSAKFKMLPGSPIAYWASDGVRDVFLLVRFDRVIETRK